MIVENSLIKVMSPSQNECSETIRYFNTSLLFDKTDISEVFFQKHYNSNSKVQRVKVGYGLYHGPGTLLVFLTNDLYSFDSVDIPSLLLFQNQDVSQNSFVIIFVFAKRFNGNLFLSLRNKKLSPISVIQTRLLTP